MTRAIRATRDTVKVGTWIRNNDPRHVWTCQVLEVAKDALGRPYAVIRPRANLQGSGRRVRVRFDRIFVDSKERRQGYNVVWDDNPTPTL